MDHGSESYRRYLAGDEAGFVELVRDYKDGLMLYLNSFVGSIQVAEELTEDTFVKLGIKKPRDMGRASFKTWLYAIGRNVAIDYLRRQPKLATVPIDEGAALADEVLLEAAYLREEQKIRLHQAMRTLPTQQRAVLWLRYFDGFSTKETAAIMKKSVHSTETLAYRARQALKAELSKEGILYENL